MARKRSSRNPVKVFSFGCNGIIFLACLAFTSWQCMRCVEKYIANPQATEVYVDLARNQIFPGVTLCTHPFWISGIDLEDLEAADNKMYYNKDVLTECGFTSGRSYFRGEEWSTETCPDPEQLYDRLIPGLDSLIYQLDINFHNTTNITTILPDQLDYWTPIDTQEYGRCYTFKPSEEMRKLEIAMMELYLVQKVRIIVHTPGIFLTKRESGLMYLDESLKTLHEYKVNAESFHMLDDNGKPCNETLGFSRDDCIMNELYNVSKAKIGCTTPYAKNKSQICTKPEDMAQAKYLYEKFRFNYEGNCGTPCSYLKLDAIPMKERNYTKNKPGFKKMSYITLRFVDTIKVIEAHYLYSTLSLIAEVGGYVGLFLGYSVYQISDLIAYACNKLQ